MTLVIERDSAVAVRAPQPPAAPREMLRPLPDPLLRIAGNA